MAEALDPNGIWRLDGYNTIDKFGESATIATGQEETIWDHGGDYTYSSSAVSLFISSSDNSDAQVYHVQGLDANWKLADDYVTAAGQTKTAVPGTWRRVFRLENEGATDNAGNVYVYEDDTVTAGVPQTATKVRGHITVAHNQTLIAFYTIPAGHRGYIRNMFCSIEAIGTPQTREANISIWAREDGGVFKIKKNIGLSTSGTSAIVIPWGTPGHIAEGFPPKTDIEMRASVTGTGTNITGGFQLEMSHP